MKKSTRRRTRPQTEAEAKEIKRIAHSQFPEAFNQDAQERNRNRNPDGTVIQPKPKPKTESIVNSYTELGYLIAEIARSPKNDNNDDKKKKPPTLGDAVNLAKPHTPSDPEQDALDNANNAIAQRDGEKSGKIKKLGDWIKKKLSPTGEKPPVWTDAQRKAYRKLNNGKPPGKGRGGPPPYS